MEFLFVLTPKDDDMFVLVVYQKRPGLTNLVVYTGGTTDLNGIAQECLDARDAITASVTAAPLF